MEEAVKHIVITGPESSGKTTLAKALAKALNIGYTEEYAREYLDSNSTYKQGDLLKIAKGQLQKEKANHNPIAIHDTDLITIKIWSEYKYNKCNPWIIEQIEQQKAKIACTYFVSRTSLGKPILFEKTQATEPNFLKFTFQKFKTQNTPTSL